MYTVVKELEMELGTGGIGLTIGRKKRVGVTECFRFRGSFGSGYWIQRGPPKPCHGKYWTVEALDTLSTLSTLRDLRDLRDLRLLTLGD